MGLFSKRVDRQLAAYQRELIDIHYKEVDTMYREMRGWRHDYHNHIQAMKALNLQARNVNSDNPYLKQIDDYLNNLNQDLTTVDTVLKTGNIMVDAILNSKLSLIKSKGISVKLNADKIFIRFGIVYGKRNTAVAVTEIYINLISELFKSFLNLILNGNEVCVG